MKNTPPADWQITAPKLIRFSGQMTIHSQCWPDAFDPIDFDSDRYSMSVGLFATLLGLQNRPCEAELPWFGGMEAPDSNGVARLSGARAGSKRVRAFGLLEAEQMVFIQTDDPSFGIEINDRKGCCLVSFDDFELLLSIGGWCAFPDVTGSMVGHALFDLASALGAAQEVGQA